MVQLLHPELDIKSIVSFMHIHMEREAHRSEN